jgi:murein DD-endopeptidase MepM/ murein hydrolase activator NlpD
VNAYRKSVDEVAQDIEERQDALDSIVRAHLGPMPATGAAVLGDAKSGAAPAVATPAPAQKISMAVPGAQRLRIMQLRQSAFEARLFVAAQRRILRLEKAIRGFGVNPAQIAAGQAMGGPFMPVKEGDDRVVPDLRQLAATLGRLNALETGLARLPSGRPALAPMETSSYGYRRDPFNGLPAFHSGIDFPGDHGQPILAAADGTVSFAGVRNGYGNVVEVEHGNGFMTRYAHLSGFAAREGQKVTRGQPVGRMGSTGRSTGTHLHFEVRVNGAAIDPRPFLEARQDVLEIQQIAQRRHVVSRNGR